MSYILTGKVGTGDNLLYSQAGTPALDLRFASTKSLTDFVTQQNLVTFTRASSATYVGSDGLIKTATTNLLLRSEEFDNASWINQNTTETIDASISTPTGGSNAYRLIDNSSNVTHNIYQTTTIAGGTSATLSVYARQATLRYIRLSATVSGTDYAVADFDLQTGTVTQTGNGATGTVSNATAQSVGNGWIRCSAVFNTSGANRTTSFHTLDSGTMPISGFGVSPYIGVGGYVHIWGAQLEQSSTVGEYIPTTSTINSAPRFDHNPTTGESLGLLVEEQRTNLLLRSEEFDNASWGKNFCSVVANTTTAPDGTVSADLIREDASTNTHGINQPFSTITTGSFTVFCKAAGRNFCTAYFSGSGQRATVFVNLLTGAITQEIYTGTTKISSTVTSAGSGWWKISVSATGTSLTSVIILPSLTGTGTSSGESYLGDGVSGIYVWGAQLETGAFPTSYIPTTTAAATRSADVASITGTNFSSWYNQTEGTLLCNAKDAIVFPSSLRHYADLTPNSLAYSISIVQSNAGYTGPGQNIVAGVYNLSLQAAIDLNAQTAEALRVAIAYKANDVSASRNGVLGTPDTVASLPTPDRLLIGSSATLRHCNSPISRITFWPQRLPDSTLQVITQ